MDERHEKFMKLALREAQKAGQKDEVPVGAVLVAESGDILALSHNRTIELMDPVAHAEIIALREAAQKILNYRLLSTTLYVTVEPCIMCMGAIVHARVSTVVFGVRDAKWGAAGSLYNFSGDTRLNHRPQLIDGVCEDECRALMQDFFRSKRNSSGSRKNINI
jgi:tRNA(adenine34) deaminase